MGCYLGWAPQHHHLQLQQHSLSITHESDQSSSSHPVPSYPDVNLLIIVVIMDFYCFCRYVVLLCVLALQDKNDIITIISNTSCKTSYLVKNLLQICENFPPFSQLLQSFYVYVCPSLPFSTTDYKELTQKMTQILCSNSVRVYKISFELGTGRNNLCLSHNKRADTRT